MFLPEFVLEAAETMFFLAYLAALLGSLLASCAAVRNAWNVKTVQLWWQESAENVHQFSTSLCGAGWILTALLFCIANKETEIGELTVLSAMAQMLTRQAGRMWDSLLVSIFVYVLCLFPRSGWGRPFAGKVLRKMVGWIVALVLAARMLSV